MLFQVRGERSNIGDKKIILGMIQKTFTWIKFPVNIPLTKIIEIKIFQLHLM